MSMNFANRTVCDVDIRKYADQSLFMHFDTANTTTAGIDSANVYAMAKGARRIAFADPSTGTITVSAQVYPFQLFSLFSDGTIETSAAYADSKVIECTTAGELSLTVTDGTITAGSVVVFPVDEAGVSESFIVGSYTASTTNKFTATSTDDIEVGKQYKVCYIVTKTSGVKKVAINDNKDIQYYDVTMSTLDKAEDGTLTPFKIHAYKCAPVRSFELSFSSEGDPASIDLQFEILTTKAGDFVEIVEIG